MKLRRLISTSAALSLLVTGLIGVTSTQTASAVVNCVKSSTYQDVTSGYTYVSYTSPDGVSTCTYHDTSIAAGAKVDYFVVAGGASGGTHEGPGGGAGGVLQGSILLSNASANAGATVVDVQVGKGGDAIAGYTGSARYAGHNGDNSLLSWHSACDSTSANTGSFATLTALGGGGGFAPNGSNGGSGGGGWVTGGSGEPGQGHNGGTGSNFGAVYGAGGGGGGGTVGGNFNSSTGQGGAGGAGVGWVGDFTSTISTGVGLGGITTFAGGGGGGTTGLSGGVGGAGGGGAGGYNTVALTGPTHDGVAGAANTGGGGGGDSYIAGTSTASASGAGGSGVVILRWQTTETLTGACLLPTDTNVTAGTVNPVYGYKITDAAGVTITPTLTTNPTCSSAYTSSDPALTTRSFTCSGATATGYQFFYAGSATLTVTAGCTRSTTTDGGYTYIAFVSPDGTTCELQDTLPTGAIVDYLVVGGGGGGGRRHAGGGGAGGFLSGTLLVSAVSSNANAGKVTLTVGKGGSGLPQFSGNAGGMGSNGDDSQILYHNACNPDSASNSLVTDSKLAFGGGGGGWGAHNGLSGGSGGGAYAAGGASINDQGGVGGAGSSTNAIYGSGGGGGAGGSGYNFDTSNAAGGAGGQGSPWISDFTTSVATALGLSGRIFAGGGGGGTMGNIGGAGGTGGGGTGGHNTSLVSWVEGGPAIAGTDGAASTGGGGGGGAFLRSGTIEGASGNGGSGVVILRYKTVQTTIGACAVAQNTDITYGTSSPTYNYSFVDAAGTTVASNLITSAPTCSSAYTSSDPVSTTRTISCTGGAATGYQIFDGATATATVVPKTLLYVVPSAFSVVQKTNPSSVYPLLISYYTGSASGTMIDPTASVGWSAPTCDIASGYTTATAVGTYTITCSGGNGGSLYDFDFSSTADFVVTALPSGAPLQTDSISTATAVCTNDSSTITVAGSFDRHILNVAVGSTNLASSSYSVSTNSVVIKLASPLTNTTTVYLFNGAAPALSVAVQPCASQQVSGSAGHGSTTLSLTFKAGSAKLSGKIAARIASFIEAHALKSKSGLAVSVVGLGENRLPLKRAKAVASKLAALGIKAKVTTRFAKGSSLRRVLISFSW